MASQPLRRAAAFVAIIGAATAQHSFAGNEPRTSAPSVLTLAATSVGQSTATANGTVNPNGADTVARIEYGFTTSYGQSTTVAPAVGSGTSLVAISAALTGLSCNSIYHFRAAASSSGGSAAGADMTFTTGVCPPPSLRPYGAWVDLAWQSPADVDALIDKLTVAGVQTVRMAFRWVTLEPAKGQWSFATHDAIVTKLRAHGIEVLGLLQHPPDWASNGGPSGISPPSDADWQSYVSQTASHYRGQVANWEIWNEENLHFFWYPQPDVVRYVQLLKIAFNTIRSVDPNAVVVLGGIGGNGVFMGWEQPNERNYLQALYDAGAKGYFDIVAIHPYDHPLQEGFNVLNGFVHDTRNVMIANGDGNKRLWLTETGWSIGSTGWPVVINETDQGHWLTTVFQGRAALGVDRIFWFSFKDAPNDPDEFGMVRHDLSLRPAYSAFQAITSAPPAITTQPQSQKIAAGHIATIAVTVSGAEPCTYQWYRGSSGDTANPVAGNNASSYTTPPLSVGASYWVRVTNANGTIDSASGTLTVGTGPVITVQPQSQKIGRGQTATLIVASAGSDPLSYQWYLGTAGDASHPLNGATASSYTTPPYANAASYWVRVSNGYLPDASSTAAAVTLGVPPVITASPQSQRIATGGTAALGVTASGDGPLSYQWYSGATGSTANPIGGATLSSYTTPSLPATAAYWVRVSSPFAPAVDSATATITVGPAASPALAASGARLTVTTANAVATFNGADLIGLVNSLTHESYLNNPSDGHIAIVDAITSTGPAMVLSNWTIGTEAGTGVPIATLTDADSLRSLALTVKIDPASQEIVLTSSASVTSPGVRGAQWVVAGLDLAAGRWIVPAKSGVVFDKDHHGVGAYIEYPFSWQAQMAVFEAAAGSFLLYSTDSQYRFKQLRHASRDGTTIDVGVYTEATAPWRSATVVPQVEWRLKAFAGDWRAPSQAFRSWLTTNRPPVSDAAHPWVSNIRNVVGIYGRDASVLAPLAAQVAPSQTLLYLVDWRQDGYDIDYPDYTPGSTTASLIAQAHVLGFKVMLHTDLIGVSPGNADYAGVAQYQARTPESLDLMGWNWDKPPSTPQRYGIINPAASAFRAMWIARIGAAVSALAPDALHLDFNGDYNDGNGLIEGKTYAQGDVLLHEQIVAAFPNLALAGEIANDLNYRYYSFAQAGLEMAHVPAPGHPIVTFLFDPKVLPYGHLSTPPASSPAFKPILIEQQRRAVVPLLHIDSANDLDLGSSSNARLLQIMRAVQNDGLQPAWNADWTGVLIRYAGINGASAALADRGGLLSLETSQSTLFQLAHDANQVSSAGLITDWAAFDEGAMYGLDPAALYFVEAGARPDATHATSLPPGVRIASGTLVTPAFAHIELAPPAPFDFTLSNARPGVKYQGLDYPLGYGATIYETTDTVGGVARAGWFVHPPWQGQAGGETFAEYSVPVQPGAVLVFSVGINDGATCTDGVTFRVTAGPTELWRQHYGTGAWHDAVVGLTAYAGTTISLRLISNPGPAANASCDWSAWSGVAIVAPTPAISVPMTFASGSIFTGLEGASFTSTSATTGIVNGAGVPGGFTIFTQRGEAVGSGTNLATLPFGVWRWDKDATTPQHGSVFGAGTVGPQTSGGLTRNPGIFAHPPNASRTVLSWTLRLPETSALQLDWRAGVIDGALSNDGVLFSVMVNGNPYWTLTAGARGDNHWMPGTLNLARWQGQSVVIELVTDSLADNNSDWAAWSDLVLSDSRASCGYTVPASASSGVLGGAFSASVTAPAACSWSASSNVSWLTVTSGSGAGNGSVSYAVAPNAGERRTGTLTIGGQTLTVAQSGTDPAMMIDRIALSFTAVSVGAAFATVTAPQQVRMTQSGPGTVTWTASSDSPWLIISPASGTGTATLTVSAGFVPGLAARQSGSIILAFSGAATSGGSIAVTLNAIAPAAATAPFGSFDTPTDGVTGLAGSIAVTGWALDDVQVTRVTVCRDALAGELAVIDANCAGNARIYIGDAVFVDGARPDVQALNPALPLSSRAGWGYLMLTNFLPALGNGTFTLRAYAFDGDGHSTALGSKVITCNNAGSAAPFGAIDLPAQGAVVSGAAFGNVGWVLAPTPNFADPPDGGVVNVFVDGTIVGSPGLWTSRADLSALFPIAHYPGINKALGILGLDTTTLTNGVHTIFWVATGSSGSGAAGIGSRFITVSNGSALRGPSANARAAPHAAVTIASGPAFDVPPAAAARLGSPAALAVEIDAAPVDTGAIQGRRGFDLEAALQIYMPLSGRIDVHAEELDRIELHLSGSAGRRYTGYLRTDTGVAPLPVGSMLDPATGVFTWMPGVGFYGTYDLTFVRWIDGRAIARQDVRITLGAGGTNRIGR